MAQGERVKEIRKNCGLTLEKFGARLGIGKTAVSKIEHEQCALTDQVSKAICREFNVNEKWLRDGIGEPFRETGDGIELLLKNMQVNADDQFYRLMLEIGRTYQQLSDNSKQVLQEFVNSCIKNVQEHSPKEPAQVVPFRLISYYYKNASAGTGKLIIDNVPEDDIEIPDIPEYRNVSYAIGVNGDSMEPTYQDGDILLVEATQEIRIGEIGIFQVDGEAYVKQLGDTELISLNQEYDNIPLDESSRTMGRVIGKLNAE